jgi:hypothetical protein
MIASLVAHQRVVSFVGAMVVSLSMWAVIIETARAALL